jgi:fibro-slime domain-containing protein
LIVGVVAPELTGSSNPQFTTAGRKVIHESTDSQGRAIAPHLANEALGDTPADIGSESRGGVESESSFAGWFADEMGTNLSTQVEIAFLPIGDGVYVFDTEEDAFFAERGGFFPIDNMLYGNERTGGGRHNYNFSFELHADFTYRAQEDQFVEVDGNSEIWVYIDGALVIDLGGVRPSDRRTQYFDLNRLGVEDGSQHTISIFIANRHRGTPNFRLETNILVAGSNGTSVTPTFD